MAYTFDMAFEFVVGNEGGYVNDARDDGGATNFGVTQATFDAYCDRMGKPRRSVKSIATDDAKAIYRTFWMEGADVFIGYPGLALQMFDHSINSGSRQAIRLLQRCVGARPLDGVLGPETCKAVSSFMSDHDKVAELAKLYADARFSYYESLSNPAFEHGWLRRVLHTGLEAMRLCA